MKQLLPLMLAGLVALPGCLHADWRPLLDEELSSFEVFLGVPHASVEGLPEGTYQSDNVHDGTPMGLGKDPKRVFSVVEEGGEPVLRISGEIYGGLTSRESFGNYHLRLDFRWGDRKWEPRLEQKRDSGLLYHGHGEHGAFWKVWKSCLELQIQESDLGDFIPLPPSSGPSALVRGGERGGNWHFDPASDEARRCRDYTHASAEPDQPHGEWNRIELYAVGSTAVHVVNGEVVMVVEEAQDAAGQPLVEGQLQIQSEAAECAYRGIEIRAIEEFPEEIRRRAGLDRAAGGWRELDPVTLPTPRHEAALAEVDGILHLLGGRGMKPVEAYDPATRRWERKATPPIELHHFQPLVHEGRILVIGAFTGGFPNEQPVPVIHLYDPAQDEWSTGAEIPEARRRGSAGVVMHEGAIYLVGGIVEGHQGGFVPWLDRYDPATGEWTVLPDAPRARDHFQAAVVDGQIVAAAGRTTSHRTGKLFELTVAEVDAYDIATGEWRTLERPIPTPRAGTMTVALDGRVIVIGGESGTQEQAHDEVEALTVASGEWSALPSLNTGRHGGGAVVWKGAIHACAGCARRGGSPELASTEVMELKE